MFKHHKTLLICSLSILALGFLATYSSRSEAFGHNQKYGRDCRSQGDEVSCRRKGGDMFIYTSRAGYYGRSSRLGSRGNRNYRGGGLRGGK